MMYCQIFIDIGLVSLVTMFLQVIQCWTFIIHTHYHNSNLIWLTVPRRVDEVIPSNHVRRIASRVIQWYGLIHET